MATKNSPAGDIAEQVADEQEKGYLGVKVDPQPDSAYSLESGPDSPSVPTDESGRIVQPAIKEG